MCDHIPLKNCLISIEGNIGVGKTSFLNLLKKALGIPFELVPEPVSEWQEFKQEGDTPDAGAQNILGLFYKDPKRWAYLFQTLCFGSRIKNILPIKQQIEKDSSPKLYIFERSIESDREIFAKSFHLSGFFNETEWLLYNEFYEFMTKQFAVSMNGIIYLRAKSSICLKRCKSRARDEENSIDPEYLEEMDVRHEEWLRNRENVLIIDAEENYLTDLHVQRRVIQDIRAWMVKLIGLEEKKEVYV